MKIKLHRFNLIFKNKSVFLLNCHFFKIPFSSWFACCQYWPKHTHISPHRHARHTHQTINRFISSQNSERKTTNEKKIWFFGIQRMFNFPYLSIGFLISTKIEFSRKIKRYPNGQFKGWFQLYSWFQLIVFLIKNTIFIIKRSVDLQHSILHSSWCLHRRKRYALKWRHNIPIDSINIRNFLN